ncbi:hypothetical protein FACS1894170_04920 [Planctomycetales bacterium]|nr:hypothetical protein FACS1894170_04920 [Planctomycetales bacterium]
MALLFTVVPHSVGAANETVAVIEAAFGAVQKDKTGTIIAVDLANDRASASDEVAKKALELPDLKSLRIAGSTIKPESFAALKSQTELTDLFLKDVKINDNQLHEALKPLIKLQRLTLRRLPDITTVPVLPALRNLSLLEISFTPNTLPTVLANNDLTALDLRGCNGLTADNYKTLSALSKLVDLKIGGFAVNDEVLKAITPLPNLTGLTIDDTFITAEGFADYVKNSPSATTLKTLVINKGTLLDDDLMPLKGLPKIDRLLLCDMMLTGEFLSQLADDAKTRPKLKNLVLRRTLLTSKGAAGLRMYPEIADLDLSGTSIDEDVAKIVVSLPELKTVNYKGSQIDEAAVQILQKISPR